MKKTLLVFVSAVLLLTSLAQSQDDLQGSLNKLAGKAALGYIDPITQGFLTNLNGGLFNKAPQAKLFGIDIELGAAFMYTPLADLPKTFDEKGTFRFNQSQADEIALNTVNTGTSADAQMRAALSSALQQSDFGIRIYGPTVLGDAPIVGDPNSPQVKIDMNGAVTTKIYTGTPFEKDTTFNVNYALKTGLGGVGALSGNAGIPFFAPQLTLGTIYGTKFTLRYVPKIPIPDVGDLSWTGFGIQHNLG